MRTYLDCTPCLLRLALGSARQVSDDDDLHEKVVREALRALADMDMSEPPPAMARHILRGLRRLINNDDPYRRIKEQCNRTALQLLPELKEMVRTADDPFDMAVRLAIAGNIIDTAVHSDLDDADIHAALEHAVAAPFEGDVLAFAHSVQRADRILYLADNAGEIVFDRLLLEQLPTARTTVVVRGKPVINDATIDDARMAGLPELVQVIGNGSDVPGTILPTCSREFRNRFDEADLIIAKGQGNYETLSDVPGKDVIFLLKVKCPVVARDLGCDIGCMVLRRSGANVPRAGEAEFTDSGKTPCTRND